MPPTTATRFIVCSRSSARIPRRSGTKSISITRMQSLTSIPTAIVTSITIIPGAETNFTAWTPHSIFHHRRRQNAARLFARVAGFKPVELRNDFCADHFNFVTSQCTNIPRLALRTFRCWSATSSFIRLPSSACCNWQPIFTMPRQTTLPHWIIHPSSVRLFEYRIHRTAMFSLLAMNRLHQSRDPLPNSPPFPYPFDSASWMLPVRLTSRGRKRLWRSVDYWREERFPELQ